MLICHLETNQPNTNMKEIYHDINLYNILLFCIEIQQYSKI